eukprot:482708-Alexandrium_andersonii.AAC.1
MCIRDRLGAEGSGAGPSTLKSTLGCVGGMLLGEPAGGGSGGTEPGMLETLAGDIAAPRVALAAGAGASSSEWGQ